MCRSTVDIPYFYGRQYFNIYSNLTSALLPGGLPLPNAVKVLSARSEKEKSLRRLELNPDFQVVFTLPIVITGLTTSTIIKAKNLYGFVYISR